MNHTQSAIPNHSNVSRSGHVCLFANSSFFSDECKRNCVRILYIFEDIHDGNKTIHIFMKLEINIEVGVVAYMQCFACNACNVHELCMSLSACEP